MRTRQHDAIIDRDVWDEVQRLLAGQAPCRKSKVNMDRRCLLTSLIFDETGDRLCPTYAKKDGRIHTYYISKRLMNGSEPDAIGWRLPGGELETSVVDAVVTYFENEEEWVGEIYPSQKSSHGYGQIRDRVEEVARQLRSRDQGNVRTALIDIVDYMTVAPGQLSIRLKKGILGPGGDGHEIVLPFHTKRPGVETKIILGGRQANCEPDRELISLIARTHRWFGKITNGETIKVREIARDEGMDEGDVSRFLPLAFLAPDIVEAILAGRQPVE